MPCSPKIEQPQLNGNDITFRGHCDGNCDDALGCQGKFTLTQDGKVNKGAKITGSGYGSSDAFIRVTADSDIDNGVVTFTCRCGRESTSLEYQFTLEHRVTVEDVIKAIVTLGVDAILKKI